MLETVVRLKANQNHQFMNFLTAMRERLIHNLMDTFWGKSLDGKGLNWNGRILEKLRTKL